MGLFSGIAKVVKGAVTGFNPVGMLASAAVNALVGKYQTGQQNKAIEAANATALERESTQFERLRDSAVRAGFNPLTALRSGMFQQANLFAKEADTFRGDLFGGLAKAALATPQARLDAEMRDLERREREANVLYTGALAAEKINELNRSGAQSTGRIPQPFDRINVYNLAGQRVNIPYGVAVRLDIPTDGTGVLITEDFEGLGGEIAGEIFGLGAMGDTFGMNTVVREGTVEGGYIRDGFYVGRAN
jgi:hypothetical protein